MSLTAPDWLTRHGGELRQSKDSRSWSVYFAGALQYVLLPVPAKGAFTCRVTQTINGKRLDGGKTYPTPEEAARGGLEELRAALGW
jgi:hypothetical protein